MEKKFEEERKLHKIQLKKEIATKLEEKHLYQKELETVVKERDQLKQERSTLFGGEHLETLSLSELSNLSVKLENANMKVKKCMQELRRKEEEAKLCVICLEVPKTILMLPCGHKCLCSNCALPTNNRCPICRTTVTTTVKVFE